MFCWFLWDQPESQSIDNFLCIKWIRCSFFKTCLLLQFIFVFFFCHFSSTDVNETSSLCYRLCLHFLSLCYLSGVSISFSTHIVYRFKDNILWYASASKQNRPKNRFVFKSYVVNSTYHLLGLLHCITQLPIPISNQYLKLGSLLQPQNSCNNLCFCKSTIKPVDIYVKIRKCNIIMEQSMQSKNGEVKCVWINSESRINKQREKIWRKLQSTVSFNFLWCDPNCCIQSRAIICTVNSYVNKIVELLRCGTFYHTICHSGRE